jgi:Protein of unknown function (DUF3710)
MLHSRLAKKGGTVKFSRGGSSGGRHSADDPRRAGRHSHGTEDVDLPGVYEDDDTDALAAGPYDIVDAPAGVARVDLGSLQIPSLDGVEVRVQANAEGVIQQVVLTHGGSALQLGVFAAPRTEGIWDEVRAEIRKSLFDDGVAVEEIAGSYGKELRARVRNAEGMMDIRFIGIDGPRWMLRAVYQGAAAVDPSVSAPLAECLRGLVVDRGREAMPVREALPLRLPKEIAEAAKANAEAATPPAAAALGGSHRAPTAPQATVNGSRPAPDFGSELDIGTTPDYSSRGRLYGGGLGVNGNSNGSSNGNGAGPASPDADAPARRRPSPRPRRSE